MSVTTLVNGQYADAISVHDRGLAYGDGVFETINIRNGYAIDLPEHLARLSKGCQRLAIRCDLQAVQGDVIRVLGEHSERAVSAVLKIIVTRETTGRSYQTHRHAAANYIICLTDLSMTQVPALNLRRQQCGVAVAVCNHRLPINPKLAGIKHLCRLDNVLTRTEWDSDDIAEGLVLDTYGYLIEGTMSNVFLVKDSNLYTPSLHRCGVEGIIRRQIISEGARQSGSDVLVVDLTLDNVYRADEVFLCNSLIGIWPVIAVGCHRKKIGQTTRVLQAFLNHSVESMFN